MMKTTLHLPTLLGILLLGLLASCGSSSGGGSTSPDLPPANSPVIGTWSLGTTGVLLILTFDADGTYSETYCDSTRTPRWIRQSGTWTATDSTVTTTIARTAYGSDTLHLAGAANPQTPQVRQFTISSDLLILSSISGGVRVSMKYVSGTSGVLPAASSVAAPTFSVPGGAFASAQQVALSTTTTGAAILYSLDGSNPTTFYGGPILVSSSETIRAVAVLDGALSAIASATYTISGGGTVDTSHNTTVTSVASPTFDPGSTSFSTTMMVALATTTEGATIYYTLTGLTPSTYSTVYTAPFLLITNTTVKAIAVKNGVSSEISTATYQVGTTSDHDASVLGTWKSIQTEPSDGSSTTYIDTLFWTFKANGTSTEILHVKVVPPTGSSYVKIDTISGSWSTSNGKLNIQETAETTTSYSYSISGPSLTLQADAKRLSLTKQ